MTFFNLNFRKTVLALAGLVCANLFAEVASAATIELTATADTTVYGRNNAWADVNNGSATASDLHQEGNGSINFFTYAQFDLSGLNIGTINSATLSIMQPLSNPDDLGTTRSSSNPSWVDDRIDFYGLDNVAGATAQNWSEGTLTFNLTGAELNFGDIVPNASHTTSFAGLDVTLNDNGSPLGTDRSTLSDASFTTWLNARVDDNGLVTVIVDTAATQSLAILTKEGAAAEGMGSYGPTLSLDYTAIPEPSTVGLMALGGLAMVMRRRMR